MELWCLDDTGRDSWDWVGPPSYSPEWGGGSSPGKTEPLQIVLLLWLLLWLFWTRLSTHVSVDTQLPRHARRSQRLIGGLTPGSKLPASAPPPLSDTGAPTKGPGDPTESRPNCNGGTSRHFLDCLNQRRLVHAQGRAWTPCWRTATVEHSFLRVLTLDAHNNGHGRNLVHELCQANQGTCRCTTTDMPTSSKTATVELHSFPAHLDQSTVVEDDGQVKPFPKTTPVEAPRVFCAVWPSAPDQEHGRVHLDQELHLWNLHWCRPHTGHEQLVQKLHLWNLYGFRRQVGHKQLVRELHLWTVRRKPGTCRCITTA